jgi:hypothetical protein
MKLENYRDNINKVNHVEVVFAGARETGFSIS